MSASSSSQPRPPVPETGVSAVSAASKFHRGDAEAQRLAEEFDILSTCLLSFYPSVHPYTYRSAWPLAWLLRLEYRTHYIGRSVANPRNLMIMPLSSIYDRFALRPQIQSLSEPLRRRLSLTNVVPGNAC